jgi:hypothetical protein
MWAQAQAARSAEAAPLPRARARDRRCRRTGLLRGGSANSSKAPERIEPVEAVEIAADAKTLKPAKVALAVVDREAREFDRQMLAAIGRPVHGDAGPGVVARKRLRDAAVRIERKFVGDLAPGAAEACRPYARRSGG